MPEEFKHVYTWLDEPSLDDAERDAKEWLNLFCAPCHYGKDAKLDRHQVTVEWRGQRYICSGASRMGDVWLKNEGSSNYYDHRVNVEELSHWKRINLPSSP